MSKTMITSKLDKCKQHCQIFFRHLFHHAPARACGLILGYAIIGAFVFKALEAPNEVGQKFATQNYREKCTKDLWVITDSVNIFYEKNWTHLVEMRLLKFEDDIAEMMKNGTYNRNRNSNDLQWSFSGALFYCISVITTTEFQSKTSYYSNFALAAIMADTDNNSKLAKCRHCVRVFFTHLFSHVGLCALVVGYAVLGALAFESLEQPFEINQRTSIIGFRQRCLNDLWNITLTLNVLYEKNWTRLVELRLKQFEEELLHAVKNEGYDGMAYAEAELQWSFPGALLYCITVITTIGKRKLTLI
ncbi:uncharacterized protein CDAR_272381 [Caerostris darwini]|uniref:Uncharacterized protein n=1 Tax=Caerostris darwini TaxID=1538125 RepID=A0AAV4V026_9ARAC|nr:uncharacterized protein CDAR_272381 [Caerostris darwini]